MSPLIVETIVSLAEPGNGLDMPSVNDIHDYYHYDCTDEWPLSAMLRISVPLNEQSTVCLQNCRQRRF